MIRKSDISVIEKTRREWEGNKGEEKKENGQGRDGKREECGKSRRER